MGSGKGITKRRRSLGFEFDNQYQKEREIILGFLVRIRTPVTQEEVEKYIHISKQKPLFIRRGSPEQFSERVRRLLENMKEKGIISNGEYPAWQDGPNYSTETVQKWGLTKQTPDSLNPLIAFTTRNSVKPFGVSSARRIKFRDIIATVPIGVLAEP